MIDNQAIYDLHKHNEVAKNSDLRRLFVNMMPIEPMSELRYIPTRNQRIEFSAQYVDSSITSKIDFTVIIQDEMSLYSLAELFYAQIKDQGIYKLDHITDLRCNVKSEFSIYGYGGDLDKEYPWKEFKSILSNSPLATYEKLQLIIKAFSNYKQKL